MSHSNKTISTDGENSNFLLNLLNNEDFMNSIAPYLPENYKSMISGFKMFSSMSELFNQSNMDVSDLLGKYMGGSASAASNTNNTNTDSTNENNQEPANQPENKMQNNENNNENHTNNNDSGQTRQGQPSEADKGFSIFSNAMNQEQQKLFDDYLKQLDDLDL